MIYLWFQNSWQQMTGGLNANAMHSQLLGNRKCFIVYGKRDYVVHPMKLSDVVPINVLGVGWVMTGRSGVWIMMGQGEWVMMGWGAVGLDEVGWVHNSGVEWVRVAWVR